jgi:hypothetical protein
MAYLPKLNPTVGGGLGGLPERRATGGAVNSIQRNIIGQAVKGSLAYRNTTTGDTYSLDPIEGLTEEATLTLTTKLNQNAVAVAMFNDGRFVVAYSEMSANSMAFEIYNLDGTIAVSQVIVESGTAGGKRVAVQINPTNEQINIVYSQGLSSNAIRRAVYSSTGTLVSAPATIAAGVGTTDEDGVLDFDFWSDGWFVLAIKTANANEYQIRIYNNSGTQVSLGLQYPDFHVGRICAKTISASNRTFAVTVSMSGGVASSTGRGFVYVNQYNGSAINFIRRFLIGDTGGSSTSRFALCFNEIDNDLVAFSADQNNKVSMASSEIFFTDATGYAPSRQRALEDSVPSNFSAKGLGGDRFLVTFGGTSSGNPIYAGILNSTGDWIAPPTFCAFKEAFTFGFVKSAASITGRSVLCIPAGTTLIIKTFSHRNTVSEIYRLRGEYPVKLADYNPHVLESFPASFNVHASQGGNKFALSWQQAGQRDITWAIYSAGGTLLNGPFVNTAIVGTTVLGNSISLLLPNGNVALIAELGSTTRLGIYDPSGVLQGSLITVTTSGFSPDAEVAPNGNIFISLKNSTSTYLQTVVYSQTGTVVKAISDFNNAAITNYTNKVVYSSTNNNFFVAYRTAGNQYFNFARFDSSGTLQGSATSFGAAIMMRCAICANQDGTYSAIFNNDSSTLFYARINANGTFANTLSDLSLILTSFSMNNFQLLPNTNSELMFISWCSITQHISCIAISTSTGRPVITRKSFGIGSSWYEKYFVSAGSNYIQYRSANNAGSMFVSMSNNGDKYIATAWGDVFRLSSVLPVGDYVIDGIVNADAIDSRVEVITSGIATRVSNLPRNTAFIADANGAKKIFASKKSISVG